MFDILYHGKHKNAVNHYFGCKFKTAEEADSFIREMRYTNLAYWRVVHRNGRSVKGYSWNTWNGKEAVPCEEGAAK